MKRGILSVEALRHAVAAGQVQLDPMQSVGLAYAEDLRHKIPRSEMVVHEAFLEKVRSERSPALKMLVCGSYRRGKKTSGDIDVLVTSPDFTSFSSAGARQPLSDFILSLRAAGYLVADLACGEKKYMGVCKLPGHSLHRRIDIRCLPSDQFHFGTLYFTGSRELNVRMRQQALERGFTLSEYSLTRKGAATLGAVGIAVTSERDIFQALGLDYLQPHER